MSAETQIDESLLAEAPESVLEPVLPAAMQTQFARASVQPLIARYLFCTLALLGATGLALLTQLRLPGVPMAWMLAAFGSLLLLSLASLRLRPPAAEWALPAMVTLAVAATSLGAVFTGSGLASPVFALHTLLACVLCALVRRRFALPVVALMAAAAFGVALAAPTVTAGQPQGLRIVVHLLVLASGAGGGLVLAETVARHMRAADEREHRFRSLLGIAADGYWEIDEHYRLVAANGRRPDAFDFGAQQRLGVLPWELPEFDCSEETLDLLQADLDTRVPIRDLALQWRLPTGDVRHLVASGEPRFDARGVFTGYWGVVRDVTRELRARQALVATETRYHELFSRIPTPLVLHRAGRVIDANPAAVEMFGFESLAAMVGCDLLTRYESGDSRERARRRIEDLEQLTAGQGLPVADFRVSGRFGRRVWVRATGVRVEADDGPALLTIYVDDTERRAAEEAVRRSEAMLSHLVATSPDVITLTDLATGRYAMANQSFERITGYTTAEVVGRTWVELGIWHDPAQREAFIEQLRQDNRVQEQTATFVDKAGRPVLMRVSGARFGMYRREYVVINARDVTASERERVEREAILETAPIGIAVTRERRFVLANARMEHMFGWQDGELLGQPHDLIWSDSEGVVRVEQGEADIECQRRDGSHFVAHVLAKAIDPEHAAGGGTLWVVQDVTERRGIEAALARARDEAEAASRAKSAFLANTSHELRTPLHGMLGLADLARAPELDETRRRQYLDQISESAQSLTGIISDILDLSKIEAGKLQIEAATFDLGELLRAVCRAYGTLVQGRDLALHLQLAPEAATTVRGDPLRVRQIIGNYLGNAIKFTACGEIVLAATRTGERVRLEVQDSGDGIAPEVQARLFQPFTQADESTTRRFGGTGLGLSICRELAQLMGGTVGVTSQSGRGSCFWAELPLPEATSLAPAPPAPVQSVVDRLRGARVLMVEDNAVNMLIAVAMLERWGVQVGQAGDGREAVDEVEQAAAGGRPFDAVLMDLQMPVMSGYEATRLLRARAAGRGVPIIALTAAALVSEREQALADGMDDFLTKPIDADKLSAALSRWVGVRRV